MDKRQLVESLETIFTQWQCGSREHMEKHIGHMSDHEFRCACAAVRGVEYDVRRALKELDADDNDLPLPMFMPSAQVYQELVRATGMRDGPSPIRLALTVDELCNEKWEELSDEAKLWSNGVIDIFDGLPVEEDKPKAKQQPAKRAKSAKQRPANVKTTYDAIMNPVLEKERPFVYLESAKKSLSRSGYMTSNAVSHITILRNAGFLGKAHRKGLYRTCFNDSRLLVWQPGTKLSNKTYPPTITWPDGTKQLGQILPTLAIQPEPDNHPNILKDRTVASTIMDHFKPGMKFTEEDAIRWITEYGYAPTSASSFLSALAKYGRVHRIGTKLYQFPDVKLSERVLNSEGRYVTLCSGM